MTCPKCMKDDVSPVGTSHYICNNPDCTNQYGERVQFTYEEDTKINFPFNQIFVNKAKKYFYKKPYLKISS